MKINVKTSVALAGIAVTALIAAIILCCAVPSCGQKLDFNAVFYYVCYDAPSDSFSASSMSSVVHSYGGAGYIVESGGKYYVTVSCYYTEKDALGVAKTLDHKGLKCFVMKEQSDGGTLRGGAKKNAELYQGNLNTMFSLTKMCYALANSLDNYSSGQDGAKSVLSDVRTTLESLSRQNAANCFARELSALIAECKDVSHGYVYSYDVRRLQIAIADSICNVKLF